MSQSTTISICKPALQTESAELDSQVDLSSQPSSWGLVNTVLRVDVLLINALVVLKLAMHWCSTSEQPSEPLPSPPPSCFPREDGTSECYESRGRCGLIVPAVLIALLLACMPVVKAIVDTRRQLPLSSLRPAIRQRRRLSTKRKTVRWAI
ncbi:hypothetical protein MGG_08287 [Pyricularia oryzae 70-15]|uniref:Uncharacterized protein n=1 Tax=Pyricularia oryzae (strain 70-15 / ATCC MYA-4617 / FGSC 8958) TaxID=242507 RepID=G4MX91_PYRO7|nr:hypothetical protein, variant [Pyricularia oryzae 70-15]XP_003715796.1 uncharacterized protein MGG_08287 [Pyricularia oryzae 70-15]KAI7913406.1 hypothetical protein M9X92_009473 [Pyricularia oryzae]EHA55988.1 hypothetical protein, variant [Pyricularia oryzae 70-15]EHA55989.1 hypothetical protein MGG_08287 [Pyricularia oryzae 70-15]KAI7922375.1 hypothetical protein M0657_005644 [Pyricularia oryzae]